MDKIPLVDYLIFLLEYRRMIYGDTAVGQAFMERYFPEIDDPDLRNEINYLVATEMIRAKYVSDKPF